MAGEHLPEDVDLWPTDPYRLLNLEPGVERRTLRRAYAELVRRFKPETHPEHFRRLREAFETIERFGQGFTFVFPSLPLESTVVRSGEAVFQPPEAPRPQDTSDNPADRLWDLACAGKEHEAYAGLLALHREHPRDEAILVRLYWLATVLPAIDPDREPCDWLVAGLAVGNFGPCAETYLAVLTRTPEEAFTPRFRALLEEAATEDDLRQRYRWRWLAAARCRRLPDIVLDLKSLRPRIEASAWDLPWATLVRDALHHLAWAREDHLLQWALEIRGDLDDASHLHHRMGEDLFLLDQLFETAEECRRLPADDHLGWFAGILPRLWNRTWEEQRTTLEPFFRTAAETPRRLLTALDRLREESVRLAPTLFRFLDGLTWNWEGSDPCRFGLEDRVAHHLDEFGNGSYPYFRFREAVLTLCTTEFTAPSVVLPLCRSYPLHIPSYLLEILRQDTALEMVCRAYRAYGTGFLSEE